MTTEERRFGDYLSYLPLAGGALTVVITAVRAKVPQEMRAAWRYGRQLSAFMDQLVKELRHDVQVAWLPKDLPLEQQQFIVDIAKRSLGVQKRLSAVVDFNQVENLKNQMPEFYNEVAQLTQQLRQVDPSKLLTGEELLERLQQEAGLEPTQEIVTRRYVEPRRIAAVIGQLEKERGAGELLSPVEDLKRAFEYVTEGRAHVYLVERQIQGRPTPIGLRLVSGRHRLEVPLMTPERQFVSRTGAAFYPSWWRLPSGEEVAPDVYIIRRVTEALQEAPSADVLPEIRDLVLKLRGKAVFAAHEQAQESFSPIAAEFLQGRALVEHSSVLDIPRQREKAARQAWQQGLDITSGTPPSASATGMVFRSGFDIRRYTLSGEIADDKIYKTFARSMPLSQEARANLQIFSGRVTHLHRPAAVPQGYYRTAQASGERMLNLNYGTIQPTIERGGQRINVLQELEQLWNAGGRRRAHLSLGTTEDEMFLASSMRRIWSAERPVSYEIEMSRGLSEEVFYSLRHQEPLPPGTFLGVSPIGKPVFSGHRGGVNYVTGIEMIDEGKLKVLTRNVVMPEVGTKVFGTGGLKHTVRGFISPKQLQALYALYLRRYEGLSGLEARRVARSVSALAIRKGFKHPGQELDQWLAQLANLEAKLSASPRPHEQRQAQEAATWLERFGFRRTEDDSIARWVREDYSLTPPQIHEAFTQEAARPGSVLAKAQNWAQLMRSEMIRMGPPMPDLGIGTPATMSLEMLERIFDQRAFTKTAAHLMARTGMERAPLLRGMAAMLEPFRGGGRKYGTPITELSLAQMSPGEAGVGDWLNRWSELFPEEGIIHFRPYRLKSGRLVSYLQLPREAVRQLQGVWLDDQRNAASVWQRSLYNALEAIQADVSGIPDTPAYQRVQQALEDYYNTLQNLTVGKAGAMREVLRGSVRGSKWLQAASMPEIFAQEPDVVLAPLREIQSMFQAMPAAEERRLLQQLYGGRYRSAMEAMRAGEAWPAMVWRYPGEEVYSALPVRLKAVEPVMVQTARRLGRPLRFGVNRQGLYITDYLFKLAGGDFDADPIGVAPMLAAEAAAETQEALNRGYVRQALETFRTSRQAVDVKRPKETVGWNNTLERVLGRLVQQTAGKADVGIISNALLDIANAARAAGQPELASWTPIIAESLTLKAKHADPSELLRIHRPQELVAHIRGTGLGMDLDTRTQYLMERIRTVAPEASWEQHEANVRAALKLYDQIRGTLSQKFTHSLRRLPGTASPGMAESMLQYISNPLQRRPLGAHILHANLDDLGFKSRVGARLAPVLQSLQRFRQVLSRNKYLLGGSLAASVGLSLLRPTRDVTPEQVTGEELEAQRQEQRLPPQAAVPQPTARVQHRQHGLQMRGRGRITNDLSPRVWQQTAAPLPSPPGYVVVRDERQRWTREDLRQLERKIY